MQAVLELVPDRSLAQGLLDDLIELLSVLDAVDAGAVGDVVVDALRERVRLLEDHADALSKLNGVHVPEDVNAVELDGAVDADAVDQVIHAV